MSSFEEEREEPIRNIHDFKKQLNQAIYVGNSNKVKEILANHGAAYDLKVLRDNNNNTCTSK
jgi:hypothetical protein